MYPGTTRYNCNLKKGVIVHNKCLGWNCTIMSQSLATTKFVITVALHSNIKINPLVNEWHPFGWCRKYHATVFKSSLIGVNLTKFFLVTELK